MLSALSLQTGQDGKLLFTSLIQVLNQNTDCVCVCVCCVCERGPRGALCCVCTNEGGFRADPTEAKNNQLWVSSMHRDDGSSSFTGHVLYLIDLFCSILWWLLFQGQHNVPVFICL